MANKTPNYGLTKPLPEEFYDVNVQNENMDKIDEALGKASSIVVASEVPEDADFWIDPNDVSAEESHLTNMNNPHNVTIEQIGAAPAWFGLGGEGAYLPDTDLNNITKNGWYNISSLSGITNAPTGYASLFVRNRANAVIVQEVIDGAGTIYRRYRDHTNVWSAWEYVNPPMQLGVEYRTTERYLGKPVYAKLVDFGALPNVTDKILMHGIANISAVVGMELIATNNSALLSNHKSIGEIIGNDEYFAVNTTTDMSHLTANIVCKYTKTTD